VQPGSPISALLSSTRQPLMVAPTGGGTICGEPTLLRKLQAAMNEAARSPNKVGSRLQEKAEEGGPGDGFETQEEEVRMKELQSQKPESSHRWCLRKHLAHPGPHLRIQRMSRYQCRSLHKVRDVLYAGAHERGSTSRR
jgi:hypothetical protein